MDIIYKALEGPLNVSSEEFQSLSKNRQLILLIEENNLLNKKIQKYNNLGKYIIKYKPIIDILQGYGIDSPEILKKQLKPIENVSTQNSEKKDKYHIHDNINIERNKEIIENNNFINNVQEKYKSISEPVKIESFYKDNMDKLYISQKEDKKVNTESEKTLSRIKKNYFNFDAILLPKIETPDVSECFEKINNFIINKYSNNIYIILQFYIMYNIFIKYIESTDKIPDKNSFSEFIKYNRYSYNVRVYEIDQFYNKIKKCHEFINYFKVQNLRNDFILEVLYRSKITYSSLYKIKGEDYKELKNFFNDKIKIMYNENKLVEKKEITLKINHKKETFGLLNYMGNKNYLLGFIHDNIKINNNTKIFDLFAGSMSISYFIKSKYPNNLLFNNDSNNHLYDFYCVLKSSKDELLYNIDILNNKENINNYKELKNRFNNTNDKILKSALFFILNRIAFNGNMYYDKNQRLNITFNKNYINKCINIDNDKIDKFSKLLNNIETTNFDVLKTTDYWLEKVNEKDIVILDPPTTV